MMGTKSNKGSITVEAAVVVPIFLFVIISITFLIRVVYTHEIIQHALDETANEMAVASYIYHISGLQDIHDSVGDGMENRSREAEALISGVFQVYGDLRDLYDSSHKVYEASENLLEILKSIAILALNEKFEDIKTEICIPFVKLRMGDYLKKRGTTDINQRIRNLNIAGGLDELDFSRSSFFEDSSNDIDLIVQYKIQLPVPLKVIPDFLMIQRATARAWLGGDEAYKVQDQSEQEDIWSLDNFQRGRKIREIFGGNLPLSFPVISRFDSGKAVMIKSMDLTAKTYQDALTVEEKIESYINKLYKFRGQEEPWGSKGIVIREIDISSKELILAIPGNPIKPDVEIALETCRIRASVKGIALKIEGYGYKRQREQEGPEEQE
jgi:hypothetical protein